MHRWRFASSLLLSVVLSFSATFAGAQRSHSAKLTEAEVEQVREAAVVPAERIMLYTKFLNDRADKIKSLTNRPKSGARVLKLDDDLQDFTALLDEMADNLDEYSDRHSDIRKALKPLSEATPRWLQILRALAGEPGFDLSRKEAIESGEDLDDQAKRLLHEQNDYFATHKDERGQERYDDALKSKDQGTTGSGQDGALGQGKGASSGESSGQAKPDAPKD
jgi:hypothetical protein